MSQTMSVAPPKANLIVLADLSRDLLKVASRIQVELQNVSFADIKPEWLAKVEAAEQALDVLAQDLSRGDGEMTAWHQAIATYETAWYQVIASLGERKN